MVKKKKILVVALQVVVLGVFVVLAAASSTDGNATKANSILRAGLQGGTCGANGYVYAGTASSESGCKSLCAKSGYSYYCKGDASDACFCK